MTLSEGGMYWVAQFLGGIGGALMLWGIFSGSPVLQPNPDRAGCRRLRQQLDGRTEPRRRPGTEVVLTFIFVLVVLAATSRLGSPGFAGLAIGLALTAVHLVGIPLTGTSVNPARSLGPALIVGGSALSQVWVFIVAPLVGGGLAALIYRYLVAG